MPVHGSPKVTACLRSAWTSSQLPLRVPSRSLPNEPTPARPPRVSPRGPAARHAVPLTYLLGSAPHGVPDKTPLSPGRPAAGGP